MQKGDRVRVIDGSYIFVENGREGVVSHTVDEDAVYVQLDNEDYDGELGLPFFVWELEKL